MLEKVIWGNTVEDWGVSILIILVAIILTKLVALFNKRVLKTFTKKTSTKLDDIVLYSIESPILFAVMLIGIWIAIHRLVYPDSFVAAVDSAYKILIVLTITWFIARLVNCLLGVYWGSKEEHAKMLPIVQRSLLVLVWIIGGVMALSNVGVNISALLGTLGIGGIAFALAAQDTVKNIFGAFTILTDKPFSIGDTIRIDNFEGTIVDVGVRSTKMQNYDKRIITFPNYKIADASIINITSEPIRRVTIKLGLTYDTTPEKMKEGMNILKNIPSKIQSASPDNVVVNFSEFTDSALVINFIYFIKKGEDILTTMSDVNMEILTAFNNAGLSFAFPSQTLYLGKDVNLGEGEQTKEEKN